METWNIAFDPEIFIGIVVTAIACIILWKFFKMLLKVIAFTFIGCVLLVCFLNWRDILVWVKKQLPDEIPLTELQEAYDLRHKELPQ